MGGEDPVKIVKVGSTPPPPQKTGGKPIKSRKQRVHKKPKFGILKGGKTARNTPRFEAVRDPTSSPPLKTSSRLRILTEKGAATRRATIAADAKKRPIGSIRETLRRHKMDVAGGAPEGLVRAIYKDAKEAGMISSD